MTQSNDSSSSKPTRENFSFQTAKLEIVTNDTGILGLGGETSEAKISRISGSAEYVTEDIGGVELDLVYVPAGSYMMGSNEYDDEKPIHRVNLSAFYMGKYAITQQQYEAVMGKNPAYFKGSDRPVEFVSWDDGMEFCQKLSQRTGNKYTLPSESQWEYACRAGTTTPFCFGETISIDLANYDGNDYQEETTSVGDFPPNAFGLYDMHGNVWEWCLDTWHENYNCAPTDGSAWIKNDDHSHLLRGGSWNCFADSCRSSSRGTFARNYRCNNHGFRVVCAPSPGFS